MTQAFDTYVESHRERFLAELVEWVGVPTISQTGEGIEAGVAWLRGRFDRMGARVQVFETSKYPIVLAEFGPADAAYTLVIYGHYDVVPAGTGWNIADPFSAVIEGDRVWGRGTGDNKGQHLARMFGIELYQRAVGPLPIKVKFVLEGEEEIGSHGFTSYIKAHPGPFRGDVCCYSDAPMFPNDQPVLFMGVRGMLQLEFRARGAERGLHSGLFGGVAPAPVYDLVALLSKLRSPDGKMRLAGFDDEDARMSAADIAALKRLPLDYAGVTEQLGMAPTTGDDAFSYYRNLMCRHSFNISGISGGYTGAGARNAIPNEAIAKVDVRVAGGYDIDAMFAAIEAFTRAEGGGRVSVTRLAGEPPSKTPVDHPLVPVVSAAVARGYGRTPLVVPSMGATTPDYVFTEVLKMPSILVPFAPYDENNHVPNESTKVSLFLGGIKASAHIIGALAAR